MERITFKEYFLNWDSLPLLDVRSPGEYQKGHVPFASNLPLFTNEERAEVGTLYKKSGKEAAMLKGLDIAGSKMKWYVAKAKNLVEGESVAVHCWRGGKRSESIATLLQFLGFEVQLLNGGYKAYRNFILSEFADYKLKIIVLGGKTGSGKTHLLHQLKDLGEQVIDLEGLANHKGSAFGALGEEPQPTTEQFENDLYEVFRRLEPSRRVWIENESKSIGRVFIPQGLWDQMCCSVFVELQVPFENRVEMLINEYGGYQDAGLLESLIKIEKRMGRQQVKEASEAFAKGDLTTATSLALHYYDKAYSHATTRKTFSKKYHFSTANTDFSKTARELIDYANEFDD